MSHTSIFSIQSKSDISQFTPKWKIKRFIYSFILFYFGVNCPFKQKGPFQTVTHYIFIVDAFMYKQHFTVVAGRGGAVLKYFIDCWVNL